MTRLQSRNAGDQVRGGGDGAVGKHACLSVIYNQCPSLESIFQLFLTLLLPMLWWMAGLSTKDFGTRHWSGGLRQTEAPLLSSRRTCSWSCSPLLTQPALRMRAKWYPEVRHHCPQVPIILVVQAWPARGQRRLISWKQRRDLLPTTPQVWCTRPKMWAVKYLSACPDAEGPQADRVDEAISSALPPKIWEKRNSANFCKRRNTTWDSRKIQWIIKSDYKILVRLLWSFTLQPATSQTAAFNFLTSIPNILPIVKIGG